MPRALQVRNDATCSKVPTDAELPASLRLLSERRFGRPHGSRKVERSGPFGTLASLMQFECYLDLVLYRQELVP
jgi:hypothetical protein